MKQPLIDDLTERTHSVITDLEHFKSLDSDILNHKPDPGSWSILECIEHLTYYSTFYLPEFKKRLEKAPKFRQDKPFKSGWLGDYFAKMMLPGEQGKKTSTLKSTNPNGQSISRERLDFFFQQQNETLTILENANAADLRKTKASVSIAPWLKLRLGDALRVVVYHNQRHILQARNVLKHYRKYHFSS